MVHMEDVPTTEEVAHPPRAFKIFIVGAAVFILFVFIMGPIIQRRNAAPHEPVAKSIQQAWSITRR